MKILLTGPGGQIGWELRGPLNQLGEVVSADRSVMDLTDAGAIRRMLGELRPNLIVNAAGYTAVDKAEAEPALAEAVNGAAPGILAEEAAKLGAAIVHYSTDYVFDGAKGSPYEPRDRPNPVNVYGKTKLAGERAIAQSGASFIILRTSWVYSLRRENFLLTILRLAHTRPELRVVDDQHGCPSWSRLIAQGTVEILSCSLRRQATRWTFGGLEGLYHLACGGETTWCRLAEHILRCAGVDPMPAVTPITTEEYPAPARRPRYSTLDCRKTMDTFGIDLGPWEPAVMAALRDDEAAVAAAVGADDRRGRR